MKVHTLSGGCRIISTTNVDIKINGEERIPGYGKDIFSSLLGYQKGKDIIVKGLTIRQPNLLSEEDKATLKGFCDLADVVIIPPYVEIAILREGIMDQFPNVITTGRIMKSFVKKIKVLLDKN